MRVIGMEHIQNTDSNTDQLDGFASATAMLRALRQRHISAVELLELHLQRIEHYNPLLNAIVTPNYDNARRAAAQADTAQAQDEDRRLLGLPVTIKDCIYVKGLPTTGGLPERAEAIAEADAPLAARIRAAGAVVMGKTNVPPYAGDWQSNNPLFGRSNNPWDLTRTPGGSTGGGAAAIAAGLTPLGFGADLAGSIRVPAVFCGIYGHRPSQTAVPYRGHFPGSNAPKTMPGMVAQGPLARSAEDLELALDVIAGPDVDEDVAWRLEVPLARHNRLTDFRVAVLPQIGWLPVDDEIITALDELATQLGRVGVQVKVIQPEAFADLRDYFNTYVSILAAWSTTGRPREKCLEEAENERRYASTFDSLAWADGLEASASDYIIWFGRRDQYRAALRDFFKEWDVLLSPANFVNAFPHTDAPREERWFNMNGERVRYGWQSVYPSLATLSGHPATAFPFRQTRSGLPIGLQAVGPYLEDRTPIRFAALVAREFGGFRRPPGYD
jgi:amidase